MRFSKSSRVPGIELGLGDGVDLADKPDPGRENRPKMLTSHRDDARPVFSLGMTRDGSENGLRTGIVLATLCIDTDA